MQNIFSQKSFRLKLIFAFGSIYILWGSTYLAIKYAIETIPPFMMASSRFLIAGGILYTIERFIRRVSKPLRIHWRDALIVGSLLLFIGNGGIAYAEQKVPTGLTALLVSTTPIWIVLFDWFRPGGKRPKIWVVIGIILGFAGIVFLVSPWKSVAENDVSWFWAILLIIASISWASGSLYSRQSKIPKSPFLATSMQMLCGGILLLLFSLIVGEWPRIELSNISISSVLSIGFLVVAGSLIGFSSYIWLLRQCPPALVSTNAFINPIVAIILGWSFAGEEVTMNMLFAALIIIVAVIIITLNNLSKKDDGKIILASADCEPIEEIMIKADEKN